MPAQHVEVNRLRAQISKLNNVRALIELNPRIRITHAVQAALDSDPHDMLRNWISFLLDDEDNPLDNAITIYFVVASGSNSKLSATAWLENDQGVSHGSLSCGDVNTSLPTLALRCLFEGAEPDGFWHVSVAMEDLSQQAVLLGQRS